MENKGTRLEAYAEMQPLVQQEIKQQFGKLYKEYADKYGVASVPLHTHNGFDSPKIAMQDLQHSLAASGRITMSSQQEYRIGLNSKPGSGFSPSIIRFNGIVVNPSTAAPTIRALVVGDAFLGSSFYLQPESSSAVTIGGPPQSVVQSSSYILVNNSGSGPLTQALSSEGHIISVTYNGAIVARATIPDFGTFGLNQAPVQNGELVVNVSTLATNWHIIGSFVII